MFAGKSAASYETAKNIIQLIYCVARKINRDPEVSRFIKIIFIENYNVSKAEIIMPAADLSEQISLAGLEASGTGNMKFSMNGALTIGTDDGANVEMRESVGDQYWPFLFGLSAQQVADLKSNHTYNPVDVIVANPLIKKAVEALRNDTFAINNQEREALYQLYRILIEDPADRFLVLKDLPSYYETQKKVEALYVDQDRWLTYVIHNIAGMAPFSTDRSINNYASEIWKLPHSPLNPDILEQVRQEYSDLDKCRIF
jgi:starch phosphorylase